MQEFKCFYLYFNAHLYFLFYSVFSCLHNSFNRPTFPNPLSIPVTECQAVSVSSGHFRNTHSSFGTCSAATTHAVGAAGHISGPLMRLQRAFRSKCSLNVFLLPVYIKHQVQAKAQKSLKIPLSI